MLRVAYTAKFHRDVKRLKKKRYDLGPLEALIDLAPGHHGAIMPAVNAPLELLAEGRALGARADKRHPFCQDEKH